MSHIVILENKDLKNVIERFIKVADESTDADCAMVFGRSWKF